MKLILTTTLFLALSLGSITSSFAHSQHPEGNANKQAMPMMEPTMMQKMQEKMKKKEKHMKKMEVHMIKIENLLQQLIDLQKAK